MEKYQPELDQFVNGQPYQEIECSDDVLNALEAIRTAMERKNKHDYTPFSNAGEVFKNDVFEANAYSWAECRCEGNVWDDNNEWMQDKCTCGYKPQLYNFKWKDFEVSWYKYLGRGMSMNRPVEAVELQTMLSECLKSLNYLTI